MELTQYQALLGEIKSKIRHAQHRAVLLVNAEMLQLYWEIGNSIAVKQKEEGWSAGVIPRLAKDLKNEFSEIKGFSERNLGRMLAFYREYTQLPILPRAVAKLPWGHNILLIEKIKDMSERGWYMNECSENGWSRDVLALQIKSNLYARTGKAITNFKKTLPEPLNDLAQQTLKDPYIFDFLGLTEPFYEKDIERQLLAHVTKFLLELGKGFAFIGQQYHVQVGETDYYIDLLFYHVKLHCYVVIELKNTKFIPEYAGKLNFYLSAVDSLIKMEADNPTIGILMCRDKNNFETEFALRDINKPMGVSEFQLTEILPENLKSSLPTIEEIENQLNEINELKKPEE